MICLNIKTYSNIIELKEIQISVKTIIKKLMF